MTDYEFYELISSPRLYKLIKRYASKFLNNSEDVEDITQEILCKLCVQSKLLNNIINLKGWILTMTKNLCLDWNKKHKPIYDTDFIFNNEIHTYNPEQQFEANDLLECVKRNINYLPDNQKDVIIMKYFKDMNIEEISEITGKSANNIRVLLFRGRSKLNELICKDCGQIFDDVCGQIED